MGREEGGCRSARRGAARDGPQVDQPRPDRSQCAARGTGEESAELKRLGRENAEPMRVNAILNSASIFSAAEPDAPRRET